jgi:aminomethyltransferase
MGYVETALAKPGAGLQLMVRGKPVAARVAKLPFVPHRYYRG